MRPRPILFIALFFLPLAVLTLINAGVASSETVTCRIDGDRLLVTVEVPDYRLTEGSEGTRLEAEGFGSLQIPGAPALPMQRFLVALPPGARAGSVEILYRESAPLPGVHRIVPTPPIAMLPDMPRWVEAMDRLGREWQAEYDATYGSDAPFPADVSWLAGRGTLRQFGYASVAVCPFTYYPESGRLEHHGRVEVAIDLEFLPDETLSDGPTGHVMRDPFLERKADRLFVNYDQVASLYETAGGEMGGRDETFDYLIITTGGLVDAIDASDFVSWKTSRGHTVRMVLTTDSEVTSQPGVDLAEQIRNFLRSNYLAWGIRYVLMVGDYATVPMRICYPDPDFHVYDPWDPGLVAPGTPTDAYYADLSYPDAESWDSDGDGYHGEYGEDNPDFLAEVAVGRIPVNNSTRITYSLNKLVAFEQDTGDWKRNVLHGAAILFFENQNYSGYPFVDGATCLDSIETGLMAGYEITHFSEQTGIVTSPFDWPPLSENSFTTSWATHEFGIVNWSGHGWCDGAYRTCWTWDDGDNVPESGEMVSFRFIGIGAANVDDDHPSIVFAISCNVGYPEPNGYGNLGIDLLTVPGWGASAGIVSSARPAAISGDWKNSPGGTEQICYDFNRYLISEGDRVGDALYNGKFDANHYYGWDRVYEYMNLYNFNLYGDPSLNVGATTVDVPDAAAMTRDSILLRPGKPNPFAATTSMQVFLPAAGSLRLAVHDVSGRRVATLVDGLFEAGNHVVTWNGVGADGKRVGPGLYFVLGDAGGHLVSRKLVRLR